MDLHDQWTASNGHGRTNLHHYFQIAQRTRALEFETDFRDKAIERRPHLFAHDRFQQSG